MTQLLEMAESDLITVFAMRNDPSTLRTSEVQNPMSWFEHEALFRHAKYPKYVYKVDDKIVGYVDFRPYFRSFDEGTTEWGFHIAPWSRNKGYAKPMLKEALGLAKNQFHTIIGRIVPTNDKSLHIHKDLGFLPLQGPPSFMLEFSLNLEGKL